MRLGQHGDEGAVAGAGDGLDLVDDVVDLVPLDGADLDRRVDQAGGADDLFGEDAAGLLHLPRAGGGRDVDGLRAHRRPTPRSVSGRLSMQEGRRKPYSASVDLRRKSPRYMAPIWRMVTWLSSTKTQGVVGEVFEQGRRRLAGAAAGEVAGVVLDAGAGAGGLHHLEVEAAALLEPLGLEQLAVRRSAPSSRRLQLVLDALRSPGSSVGRGRDVVGVGVDLDRSSRSAAFLPVSGSNSVIAFDLVAEQGDAPGAVLLVGGEDLDGVAAHAEGAAARSRRRCACTAGRRGRRAAWRWSMRSPTFSVEGHRRVGLDRADAVDAGDRGDDDDVVALEERARRRVAHAVDLLVDRGFLLDVGVGARDVGLGLVVVVVGDEILDRVVGEEAS